MTKEQLLEDAKPILFNTDMVRAILDGRKSCTRRIAKGIVSFDESGKFNVLVRGEWAGPMHEADLIQLKSKYKPEDILYVRETWCELPYGYEYKTNEEKIGFLGKQTKWHPSIHMPKAAARIFLNVTDVRMERLQDITEEQAKLEGAIDNRGHIHSPDNEYNKIHSAREHFSIIWNSTIKKEDIDRYGWEENPYVWVIEFERINMED